MTQQKKLIEVALPLAEINDASSYDKMPGIGAHPKGIHLWWARLPLPVARAMLFASVVDDPASIENFEQLPPSEQEQLLAEREGLFGVIKDLMQKKPHENKDAFRKARELIKEACGGKMPEVLDPFTGGGSIPLEAQRLGFKAHGRDLNPVPALITKATIDYPARFYGKSAVNPRDKDRIDWSGSQGLAEDVSYYGDWMLKKARERIGRLYPKVEVTSDMVSERPELGQYKGSKLNVIAWIWCRTIPSPNPALGGKRVPLVSTFWLSRKKGKEAWIKPIIDGKSYRFKVVTGKPENPDEVKSGTKTGRGSNFKCLLSGVPIDDTFVKESGCKGRLGEKLIAIVCDGDRSRVYISPTKEHEELVETIEVEKEPSFELNYDPRAIWTPPYGLTTYADLFTNRQLKAMHVFCDLVSDARKQTLADGASEGLADAIATYLSFAIDRLADFNNSLCRWATDNQKVMNLFGRQAIPMIWDFAEANLLNKVVGGWEPAVNYISKCIGVIPIRPLAPGAIKQQDAAATSWRSKTLIISTDPPYYDNIGYADLSDFFYVWLRRTLREVHPELLGTMLTPKAEELIAIPYRHGGDKDVAKEYFESGFRKAFSGMREAIDPRFPLTVYYAMKQSEGDDGANTGWETLLTGLIDSGFQITATWPVRAAQNWRMISMGTNALASYVVLACREQASDAPIATRKDFVRELREILPPAIKNLQHGNIGPVDFFQAAMGPGMAVFSRYGKIVEGDGKKMTVRTAIRLINDQIQEFFSGQTNVMDSWTRFGVTWFSQNAYAAGVYGEADNLARSLNTSVDAVEESGIIQSGGGKVRLLGRSELDPEWDPDTDDRLTVWEVAHYLIRELLDEAGGGEKGAAMLLRKVGGLAEDAKGLAYRLYTICEQNKWADHALDYNALVTAWPDLVRQSQELSGPQATQSQLDI